MYLFYSMLRLCFVVCQGFFQKLYSLYRYNTYISHNAFYQLLVVCTHIFYTKDCSCVYTFVCIIIISKAHAQTWAAGRHSACALNARKEGRGWRRCCWRPALAAVFNKTAPSRHKLSNNTCDCAPSELALYQPC